jgi:hypothetical protein
LQGPREELLQNGASARRGTLDDILESVSRIFSESEGKRREHRGALRTNHEFDELAVIASALLADISRTLSPVLSSAGTNRAPKSKTSQSSPVASFEAGSCEMARVDLVRLSQPLLDVRRDSMMQTPCRRKFQESVYIELAR